MSKSVGLFIGTWATLEITTPLPLQPIAPQLWEGGPYAALSIQDKMMTAHTWFLKADNTTKLATDICLGRSY